LVTWGLAACSDDPEGNGTSKPASCTGGFCVEDDRRISTVPEKLGFADIAPGATQTLQLKVTHTGKNGTVQISSAVFETPDGSADPALTGQFALVDFAPRTLEKGDSVNWQVAYTPSAAGAKALVLVLNNDGTVVSKRRHLVPITVAAGGVALAVLPSPVDFGNVGGGASVELPVQLFNSGTTPVQLGSVKLAPTGSADFTIAKLPDLAALLAPGLAANVTLRYEPKEGNYDESALLIETLDGRKVSAKVYGNEIAADISVVPPKLNFGSMKLGEKVTLPIKVLNKGLSTLKVTAITLHPNSLVKTVTIAPGAPLAIDGGKDLKLQITLDASVTFKTSAPVASLVFASNDPGEPTVVVPMYAQSNSPALVVTPDDAVDFAIVGKGLTVKRTVELFNAGTAPLDVGKIEIVDNPSAEFALVPGPLTSPFVLEPGKYGAFDLTFTATGKPLEKAKAKLKIHSNDPGTPVYPLDLLATRADGTVCTVQLDPPSLNFGLMGYGTAKTLQLGIKNVGTGYCAFDSAKLTDCTGTATLPGFPLGPPVCKTSGTVYFKTFAPSAKLFNLAPGDSGKLQVEFTAPTDFGLFGGKPDALTPVSGLIVLAFQDVATKKVQNYPNIEISNPQQVAQASPNLLAKVGKAAVQVLPGEIDFSVNSVGCYAKAQTVTVYNAGSTDVYINKVELQGCGPEMEFVNLPAIPKSGLQVSQAKPTSFQVQYGPQNVGKDQCQVNIYTSLEATCTDKTGKQTGKSCAVTSECGTGETCLGQLFTVPLLGEGTLDTEFTDEYVQGAGKKVDVLFIIDDSGSMSEEQKNLANNFTDFLKTADIWQNDYHLGVVSTDMDSPSASGRLKTNGGVRIVTPKTLPSPTDVFKKLASLGTGGSGDEKGLAAVEAALTLPLAYDSAKSCTKDADCAAPSQCVKGADDGLLKCGGPNRSFLRKNAGLEVVILSDEEDGSSAKPSYYVNLFYSIKGLANKNLFHLHSIVGPKGGCKGAGGDAVAGERYLDVSAQTGGKVGSICDTNFAQVLKDIGQVAFGLAAQFYLTRVPDPPSIKVTVGGKPCAKGASSWAYDEASNSVTFTDKEKGGTCMPQKGDTVKIHYAMLCGKKN